MMKATGRGTLVLGLTCVTLLVGCNPSDGSREDRQGAGFEVRDSAGITIAMSSDSLWRGEDRWRVSSDPILVLGGADDQRAGSLFESIGEIEILSGDRFAVSDRRADEIRIFDQDGQFLRALGGTGEGPSEFNGLDRIGVIGGDTIVGRDVGAPKSVYMASDGSGSRSVAGPPIIWEDLTAVYVADWTRDGRSIVSHTIQASAYPEGTNLIDAEWHLFDQEGGHQGLVAELPFGRVHKEGRRGRRLVFSGRAWITGGDDGFWYGFSEYPELSFYTAEGMRQIIRFDQPPRTVPSAVPSSYEEWFSTAYLASFRGAPPEVLDQMRSQMPELTFSSTFPAFTRLLVSTDGSFWLEQPASDAQLTSDGWSWEDGIEGRSRWTVLDLDGRWLGTVQIPEDVQLRAVTENRIFVERMDALDVPQVVVYPLEKPN